jgi:hypothetical protein
MKHTVFVHGICRFQGDRNVVHDLLIFWGVDEITDTLTDNSFTLNGVFTGPIENCSLEGVYQHLLDSFEDISATVEMRSGQFRCLSDGNGEDFDFVFLEDVWRRIPLEIHPTQEALENPLIRKHYLVETPSFPPR